MDHESGIRFLSGIRIGIPRHRFRNEFTDILSSATNITFEISENHQLILEFNNLSKGKFLSFKTLPLAIAY
jgi:hypothetical protein